MLQSKKIRILVVCFLFTFLIITLNFIKLPINYLASKKIDTNNTHGTGCTLASSIACLIGHGNNLSESVQKGIDYVQKGILLAPNFGSGSGPILHFDA